jgi:multiple sugar transport system permease protein
MKKKYRLIEPYIWILPSCVLMALFIALPIGMVFRMAFSQVTRAGIVKGFTGFDNFIAATGKPAFKIVLWNTFVWTVVVVVVSTVVGFILALLLNNEFRGRKIARAIVVFPWATTLVIQASVWNFIINTDYGTLNTLLKKLGIISKSVCVPKIGSLTAVRSAADIALSMTDPVLSGPGEPSTLPASWCTSMRIPSGSDVRSMAFWLLPFHGRSTIPDSPRALI